MKPHTRRAVAFIAGSIVSGRPSPAVYDYAASQSFPFGGEATWRHVNVYDHEQRCHISGPGGAGTFSLYHYGNLKHVDLSVQAEAFHGYDYDTGQHFTGTVRGASISLYDDDGGKYFTYAV